MKLDMKFSETRFDVTFSETDQTIGGHFNEVQTIRGEKGDDGIPATHEWNGTVLTVTSASGTSSADLVGPRGADGYTPVKGKDYFDGKDGRDGVDGYTPVKGKDYFDGKNGKDGQDGYTPRKGVDYFDGKDGLNGVNGKDGYTPVKGVDYWTETDKTEIVSFVIASLPVYDGEVVAE